MRPPGFVAVFALLFGCSQKPAPVAAPPAVASVAVPPTRPEAPAPTATAAAAPAPPTEIREPTNVACRLVEKAWNASKLRLRADLPSFGFVQGAPTTLLLPTGDKPTEAIAVMDDGSILIRAVIPEAEVRFFMPKPTALLGILTLESDMPAYWVSATSGTVRVGFVASELLSPQPLETDLACENVGLIETQYDARASITKQKKLPKRETARDGVEIFANAKGRPTATLKGNIQVEIVEQKGSAVRVLIDGNGYFVSGWVAKNDLVTSQGWLGAGYGKGAGFARGVGKLQSYTQCKADVPLYVEQGQERIEVGLIHKGAGFHPKPGADPDAKYLTFELPASTWFWIDKSARLVVEAASIQSCSRVSSGF
ncbi:MAG: hypothetical protein HYZ29_15700 [Myxococcales bacterium]|nr:hypothetical protein [Myxococcales bacterium]